MRRICRHELSGAAGNVACLLGRGTVVYAIFILGCSQHGSYSENVNIHIANEGLIPAAVVVEPGTNIVWINRTESAAQVKIVSRGGETLCRDPSGFVRSKEGRFLSRAIEDGEVVSLCLLEPNEYRYEVTTGDEAHRTLSGLIRVDR